jgi:hypothetical protein
MKTIKKTALVLSLAVCTLVQSHAVTILTDNFLVSGSPDSNNQNFGLLAGLPPRQTGVLAGTGYSDIGAAGESQINNGGNRAYFYTLNTSNTLVGMSINHNFTDYSSLNLSYDVYVDSTTYAGTLKGFALGGTQTDSYLTTSGIGVTLDLAGNGNLYSGGVLISSFTTSAASDAYNFQVSFSNTGAYDGTGIATLDLTINGVVADLNGVSAGTSFTRTGLGSNNYINFLAENTSSFSQTHFGYDGLTITGTAIPEPTTVSLILLSLGAIVVLRRRYAKAV